MTDDATYALSITLVRSGGFAGLRREWSVEVTSAAEAEHWQPLVEACPWDAVPSEGEPVRTGPDRFVYDFRAGDRSAVLPETQLDGPWRTLADEVQQANG